MIAYAAMNPRATTWMLLCLTICGCRSEPAAPAGTFPTRNSYSIPAKQMLERVKTAVTSPPINLQIESEQEGRLVTSWDQQGAEVDRLAAAIAAL